MKSKIFSIAILITLMMTGVLQTKASSHREAPLIANDPLADNTDLYAFRSPDNPNKITIIASYIPMQLPHGGPNYYSFGENIRYEIHVDNNTATAGDDITYRFTFHKTNQDPTALSIERGPIFGGGTIPFATMVVKTPAAFPFSNVYVVFKFC